MLSQPKKKKLNPMLMNVIIISGVIHLIAILILGGITVVSYVIPDEAKFEEPPEVREEKPPTDVKVEIRPQEAPQSQELNQLKMKQVGDITVSAIDVDLPSMEEDFTVAASLGGFSSRGVLDGASGRLGLGISEVNIFGLKSKAERVLFAIDASKDMLVDKKGGLNSYRAIKEEITSMVENLSTGTLFNVVFFQKGKLLFFKPNPVPAGKAVAEALKKWIAPINENIKSLGLRGAKRRPLTALPEHPVHKAIRKHHHDTYNEMMYLTQVFLEQSIDAAFVITGNHPGIGRVRRSDTREEREAWREVVQDPDYREQLKEYREARREAAKKARAKLKKLNERRKRNGIPPKVIARNLVREMGVKVRARHPGHRPAHYIPKREVEKYLDDVVDLLYEDKGGEPPSMNVILFLAGNEAFGDRREDRIDDYVREFSGRFRTLRGLDEIKQAARAAETNID